ncbi:MAG: DUF2802 domain-containing protein [Rhodanobacter sp.]
MELEIAVGVLLLLAVLQSALLLQLWRQSRQLKRDIGSLTGSMSHAVQTDVPTSMLVTALGRMEQRIALIEQQPAPTKLTSYELAQQLAREGADVEQIVARCGLSRDEARLIRQLHPAGH